MTCRIFIARETVVFMF